MRLSHGAAVLQRSIDNAVPTKQRACGLNINLSNKVKK